MPVFQAPEPVVQDSGPASKQPSSVDAPGRSDDGLGGVRHRCAALSALAAACQQPVRQMKDRTEAGGVVVGGGEDACLVLVGGETVPESLAGAGVCDKVVHHVRTVVGEELVVALAGGGRQRPVLVDPGGMGEGLGEESVATMAEFKHGREVTYSVSVPVARPRVGQRRRSRRIRKCFLSPGSHRWGHLRVCVEKPACRHRPRRLLGLAGTLGLPAASGADNSARDLAVVRALLVEVVSQSFLVEGRLHQSDGIGPRLRRRAVEIGPYGGDQPPGGLMLATETEHSENLSGHSFEHRPGGLLSLALAHAHQPLLRRPRAERKISGSTSPGMPTGLLSHLARGRPLRVGIEQDHVECGGAEPVEQAKHVRCDLVGMAAFEEVTAVFGRQAEPGRGCRAGVPSAHGPRPPHGLADLVPMRAYQRDGWLAQRRVRDVVHVKSTFDA
ncbi:hypothetical protein DTL70_04340 [Streptomyces diacarni]|uniref:Uncharacterized protein n=1 Tax=Streptomyces diacarni TaxID=2800381 RepID=A0A367FDA2_9ACTN|nr:hypothetical protein DTL70_04340 [Streptomyces diacarni]